MADRSTSESAWTLAFETSAMQGGVALGCGGEVLRAQEFTGSRRHAVDLLPAVEALCRACAVTPPEIRRVYVSAGPGSFTGLRIGVTAARMIALATGARIVAVPTLEVVAQNALEAPDPPDRVVVILDAKRKRVYAATFARREGRYLPLAEPVEADPARYLADQTPSCAVLGEGVACHRSAVEASGLRILSPSLYRARCETVYRLGYARAERGHYSDPRSLIPTYVRLPEAEERWEQRHPNPNR